MGTTVLTPDILSAIREALHKAIPQAIEIRHRIHMDPRLSGDEAATRDLIVKASGMEAIPVTDAGALIPVHPGDVAVGLRAEIDALPIEEMSGVPWSSHRAGVMHACGHDVHAAATVALLQAFAAVPNAPAIVGIIQPREESWPSGAQEIVNSGLLSELRVESVIGIHLQPAIDAGVIACAAGAVNASADEFTIDIQGTAGHAAYPHRAADPVVAAAEVVMSLQHVISRNLDPMKPGVITVGALTAGEASNVIPGVAKLRGSLRAMDAGTRSMLITRLEDVAEGVARAHGCRASVSVVLGDPPLVNADGLARAAQGYLSDEGFAVLPEYRSMGADDFAFYCEAMPSLMMFLGTDGTALHHPHYAPPDDVILPTALALLAGVRAAVDGVE